ncbi:MAG TPA: SRPBCC family protein [Actinocatenispora sp.]
MSAGDSGRGGGLQTMLGGLRDVAARNPGTERLLGEVERYLSAQAERAVSAVGRKVGDTTQKLTDVATGESGASSLLGGTLRELAGGSGKGTAVLKAGAKKVGETVRNALPGGGGSGGGTKATTIIEDVDVGVPVDVAYNEWTKLEDFPSWSKGAQSVNQKDEVTSDWKAKVFWSTRNWTATIDEQVPDEHISWSSEGPKGVVNGVVSFHPLADRLTRVLLVLEYIPGGFFEKTGNLWRSQGRRARLDLKLFRRHVMTDPDAGSDGWRGEVHDGEVVSSDDADRDDDDRDRDDDADRDDETDEYDDDRDRDEESDEYEEDDEDEDEEDAEPARRR